MFKQNAQRLVRCDWLAPALDALRGDEITPEKIKQSIECIVVGHKQMMEELSQVLADQGVTLVHAGPFNAERTDTGAPGRTGSEAASEMIGPIRSLNHSSYYDPTHANIDGTTGAVVGGFAHIFRGVAHFCFNDQIPSVLINGGVERHIVALGCPDSTVRFGNYMGVIQWAKATGNHSLGSAGPSWDSTVAANVVTDQTGATTTGATVTIYLPRTQTTDPNVRTNDVIPFYYDYAGNAFIASDVQDGKVGDIRTIYVADPTTPLDYTAATGVRGWRVGDGTNGTQDMGTRVAIGWASGGSAVGTAVAAGVTGNAGTVSVSVSAHAASASAPTITIAANGAGFISTESEVAGVTASSTVQVDVETNPATGGDPFLVSSINDPGHAHDIDKAAIAGAITASATAATIAGALANHTATVASNDIASTLTPTPKGRVLLFLERIS